MHVDIALALNNLAYLYERKGAFAQATPLFEEAAEIIETISGINNPQTAVAFSNLANNYRRGKRFSDASALFQKSLRIFEQTTSRGNPSYAATLTAYSRLLRDEGEIDAVRKTLKLRLLSELENLSINLLSLSEAECFQYIEKQWGPEDFLVSLINSQSK